MRVLLIVGFILWTLGASWYWVCVVREACSSFNRQNENPIGQAALEDPPLQVMGGEGIFFQSPVNFRFPFSSSSPYMVRQVSGLLDTLANYLYYNPYKDLEITGTYAGSEINLTNWSNLGLARANSISQRLQLNNLSSDRFILSFREGRRDSLFDPLDTLRGGINLRIIHNPIPTGPTLTEFSPDSYFNSEGWNYQLINPPILYFEEEGNHLIVSEEIGNFFTDCVQFLRLYPEKKLLLTGYSDNEGAQIINVQRGIERANKVKKYFQEFGLPEERIDVLSLGGSAPIADNATEEGRKKNRRVELSLE